MNKMMKNAKRMVESYIDNYEEIPYGCGYNLAAEARLRKRAERIRAGLVAKRAAEEEAGDSIESILATKIKEAS